MREPIRLLAQAVFTAGFHVHRSVNRCLRCGSEPLEHQNAAFLTKTSAAHIIVWARLASLKPAASIVRSNSAGGCTNVRNGFPRRRLRAFSHHIPSLTYQRFLGYDSAKPRSAHSSDRSRSGRYAG